MPPKLPPGSEIRVMPGRPHSPHPRLQKPYVVFKKGGVLVNKLSKVVPPNSVEAFIPYEEFAIK